MISHTDYLQKLIQCAEQIIVTYAEDCRTSSYEEGIELLMKVFLKVKNSGRKVFFIGNGGSAAIAIHMTADYMKNGGMKTYSLYDSSVMTCMGNDYGYEEVFSRQLNAYMDESDLLLIATSKSLSSI